MSKFDTRGTEWARLSDLKAGSQVRLDDGFTCGIAGARVDVAEDEGGLFVACDHGHHYLDGQLADDGDHLVGVYPQI
ncbi:hypothetical protein [Mangrovibrevibacter kandeliae]|uniref:hypothetical protein n=1 Tax=Mangrovibrevibacter kandeliae TaxID=2968473 RepID=UPI002117E5A4|nr:hypothetical protein [Aurantimonas sp. CSK15Z-1]MCQ8781674.1 hypothetical protein [Aurantimonas sp. CSK15Z-1]